MKMGKIQSGGKAVPSYVQEGGEGPFIHSREVKLNSSAFAPCIVAFSPGHKYQKRFQVSMDRVACWVYRFQRSMLSDAFFRRVSGRGGLVGHSC